MRIRRALKKLSFVKSEHRVRGEKWEKDCGGGDITGRQNLTGTSTGLEATQRRKKWGKSEIKKQHGKKFGVKSGINASKQLSGKQRKSAAWLQAGMRCLFNQ